MPFSTITVASRPKEFRGRLTYFHSQNGEEKRRFRVREWWDLPTHREPLNRTRRSVCE